MNGSVHKVSGYNNLENCEIFDMLSMGTRPYMPAAFFLVPNDVSYRGSAIYARTRYHF